MSLRYATSDLGTRMGVTHSRSVSRAVALAQLRVGREYDLCLDKCALQRGASVVDRVQEAQDLPA